MKTKEFIKRVEELGFDVCTAKGYVEITKHKNIVAIVVMDKAFEINCCYLMNRILHEHIREKLFDLIVEYAKTPIDEREEEDKYFYEHKFIKTRGGNPTYLAIRVRPNNKYPILQGSNKNIFEYKVEFTDKEMEEVKNQYWICLDDFVKKSIIEVSE